MTARKVILFELNEVPWRVVDDFVSLHPASTLARLLPRMRTYETIAEDTALSPWITWPTLHRGVSDEQHTITDFGQDLSEINDAYPTIWELTRRAGVPTGVCGSLHSYPLPSQPDGYDFFIPDVFAAGSECFPDRITAFQDFNLAMSRESARNVSTKVPWKKALKFIAAAPGLGLKPRTMFDVGRQLVDERRRRWTKTRRRTYQVVLAFDVFMASLERSRPAFATFFTNHVASTMHRYWAARFPGDYATSEFEADWIDTYRDEISWTMSKFDEMLTRLVAFTDAHDGYELWVTSSMGQAATEATQAQTQVYLNEVETFMSALGFAHDDWQRRPAMLPRVVLAVRSGLADGLEPKLDSVEIADRGKLPWKRLAHDVYRIHPGVLQNVKEETCRFEGRKVAFAALGFANMPIEDSVGQSAYHVPNGTLLVYPSRANTTAKGARTQISTLDVAPSVLDALGVRAPSYMRAGVPL